MKYSEPSPVNHDEAERVFEQGSSNQIADTLVGLAFHDPDVYWVEAKCIFFATHSDPRIREVAAICLGHLARIHQNIHLHKVLPVLIGLIKDPDLMVGGTAEDALNDIRMFMGFDYRTERMSAD